MVDGGNEIYASAFGFGFGGAFLYGEAIATEATGDGVLPVASFVFFGEDMAHDAFGIGLRACQGAFQCVAYILFGLSGKFIPGLGGVLEALVEGFEHRQWVARYFVGDKVFGLVGLGVLTGVTGETGHFEVKDGRTFGVADVGDGLSDTFGSIGRVGTVTAYDVEVAEAGEVLGDVATGCLHVASD